MASRFCGNCGAQVVDTARFCPSCGAEQEQFTVDRPDPEPEPEPPPAARRPFPPPPEPPPAARETVADRAARVDPRAGELAGELAAQLRVPGVVAAGLAALIGAAVTFAAGLLFAALFPDDSLIGAVGADAGILSEALRQVVQIVQADVLDPAPLGAPARIAPFVFAVIPVAACAVATAAQSSRTTHLSRPARLAWAAATGVPFALLMLIAALAAGTSEGIEPAAGGAFGWGLLWGALGGLMGSGLTGARGPAPADPRIAIALEVARDTLRPLGIAIAAGAVIGTGVWLYQTIDGASNTQGSRSEALAVVENGLYAAEHGVHFTELGTLTRFDPPGAARALGLPLPVDDPNELSDGGDFRLFAYRDPMAAYVFVPLLLLAVGIPALLALYAGFSVARARGASTLIGGAAWGAAVGPVWAIALALADWLVEKALFGQPQADSVFASALLGGLVLGALGGLLASRSAKPAPRPAPAPRPS